MDFKKYEKIIEKHLEAAGKEIMDQSKFITPYERNEDQGVVV